MGFVKHRLTAGPVISLYQNDRHLASNSHAYFGFDVNYKTEVYLGGVTSLLMGLEYMNQGLKFNGYYTAPGHTYLYDNTFPYSHTLRYQEIQLPLAIKVSFNTEKNNPFSPYAFLGAGYRYIFQSTASVTSDSTGEHIYRGHNDITFENHLIDNHINTFIEGGLGIQKNNRENAHAFFIEITYKYSLSRIYYDGNGNTNKVFFRDPCLTINAGWRF